jgi:hypothetical protein
MTFHLSRCCSALVMMVARSAFFSSSFFFLLQWLFLFIACFISPVHLVQTDATLASSPLLVAPLPPLLGCNEIATLPRNEPFARGALKAVEWSQLSDGTRVVVARPHDKALKRFQLAVTHAMSPERAVYKAQLRYAAVWTEDRELLLSLRALGDAFVPRLYGGCWDSYDSLALVLEPLRNGIDVLMDETISLRQRARLAVASLALLAHWRQLPLSGVGSPPSACIYGDFHAQQFGVTSDYRVKLLDVDAKDFHCYSSTESTMPHSGSGVGRRFGDNVTCNTPDGCFEHFSGERQMFGRLWDATMGGVGQSKQYPTELQCNADTHHCNGFDSAMNLYALCVMWLRHLLVTVPEQMPSMRGADAFLTDARHIIADCSRHGRERRVTEAGLRLALERLERTHFLTELDTPLPPLPLEPRTDFNQVKRQFLRVETPPRANATELALQVDRLQQENDMLRARVRQLERRLERQ